jgi:hypothetical protein
VHQLSRTRWSRRAGKCCPLSTLPLPWVASCQSGLSGSGARQSSCAFDSIGPDSETYDEAISRRMAISPPYSASPSADAKQPQIKRRSRRGARPPAAFCVRAHALSKARNETDVWQSFVMVYALGLSATVVDGRLASSETANMRITPARDVARAAWLS